MGIAVYEESRRCIFDGIFFILVGKETSYKSLDEFEFLVSTLGHSFLIGSSSFLKVRRTTIQSWTNSYFGLIGPRTAELAALKCLKKSHRLIMG